jgi:hypothetical protein
MLQITALPEGGAMRQKKHAMVAVGERIHPYTYTIPHDKYVPCFFLAGQYILSVWPSNHQSHRNKLLIIMSLEIFDPT